MRYASIYLENYIGIYNGMGLSSIKIDFTLGTHRITIIRGDNGSGKSTIMKALSVFPDGNDQFIPGKPARKEVILLDGQIMYRLLFVHAVKPNGQREVTKAYIEKIVNGYSKQLNENGNVSSYKDILYDELGLDPNFESLSQLSTEDRGIADKKPAERKKFVNAILNNLDVYNEIYKALTKWSGSYKNLITSITNKLGSIGDINVIASNIAGIEARINQIQDKKDQCIEALASAKAKMELLDPDGSIQSIIDKISQENAQYEKDMSSIRSLIDSGRIATNLSITSDITTIIGDTKAQIDKLNVDNQIKRGQIESLLREKESEAEELSKKIQRLSSFDQDWRYEQICDDILDNESEKASIESTLSVTGISNILSFSKESYILALESIHRIAENVSDMKDACDYDTLMDLVYKYIESGTLPRPYDTAGLDSTIRKTQEDIDKLNISIIQYQSDIKALDALLLRPEDCSIDSCPYIKDAVEISKRHPKEAYEEACRKLDILKMNLETFNGEMSTYLNFNACLTYLSNLIRDIDRNKEVVSKLPCGDIFRDKQKLLQAIFKGDYSQYLESIYQYIGLANLFDRYKSIDETLTKLYAERTIYESKQDVLVEIQSDIDRINAKLTEIDSQVVPVQAALSANDKMLIKLQKDLIAYQAIADNEAEYSRIASKMQANEELYKANLNKIKDFNAAKSAAVRSAERIEEINREAAPLVNERDHLNHQLRLIDDYNRELQELRVQFDLVEKVRYYSSPTTGIQLVFMEMYMGKVIESANNLLSTFFNGQFRIMPFIINESEFRIPCAGEGIMNDDISSMSSAQIAMISMILSFSFLYNSSSRYNILKLDEIDGPLDANNRIMFMDVLNNVMNMLGTEQCIMISHNSELQVDMADIILLKSSENNDYNHGNIIWKY